MPDTTLSFATFDALFAALEAEAAPGGLLDGVTVEDGWPEGRITRELTVIVADITGTQPPATLRAGGGTRDDLFTIDVAAAAKVRGTRAKARLAASALAGTVEQIVNRERNAPGPVLGINGLRECSIESYDIRQFVVDKGVRECDVHQRVAFKGRLRP